MKNAINSFLDISDIKSYNLAEKRNFTLYEKIRILNKFLKINKFYNRIIKKERIKDNSKMTKYYQKIEDYQKNENHSTEEILKASYKNVLKINFQSGDIIIYGIDSENCFAEKIVPLSYSYNLQYDPNIYQDIIIYNFKNDNKIYYGLYNTQLKNINQNSLKLLINEPFQNYLNIILINKGIDLFILTLFNSHIMKAYYIIDFTENPIINKYEINSDDYWLINNDYIICIQTENKIFFINNKTIKIINIYGIKNNSNSINLNNNTGQINNGNNINIDDVIQFQNNLLNEFGGDMNLLIENLNNINIPPTMNYTHTLQNTVEKLKYKYENILKIDEKFFVSISSKRILKYNNTNKIYIFLSLFDFDTLEEISKIELDILELNCDKIKVNFYTDIRDKYKINIIIEERNKYEFLFNKGELIRKE